VYDCVITGGIVVDGTGSERRRADIGVRNGRIVALGTIGGAAKRTIDARDRIVAPGFVDIHTHFGIRGRGRISEGWRADLVVFDAERIGPGPVHTRHDLPAGAGRLYAEAEGIDCVLVNGVEIVRGKEFTDARPGAILRSGRHTETVEVPGGRVRGRS
jgi:N-acyl-D-aspartate/D-glutamate deacylase